MKRILFSIIAALAIPVYAQTNTPSLTNSDLIPGPVSGLLSFLSSASNLMVAPYGIASTGAKYGGGIALAYRLSDMIVPTIRVDYFDGRVWMPSADMQLQAPLLLGGKVTVIPFGFVGIATPLTGKAGADFSAVGLVGVGGAIRLGSKWDVVADVEKWSGFRGEQIRFGLLYKF